MSTKESEILDSLYSGRSLVELDLPFKDGRLIVQNIDVEVPKTAKWLQYRGTKLVTTNGKVQFLRRGWSDLHFVGCNFCEAGFDQVSLSNCIFEKCDLQGVGFWECQVADCTFDRCDLRDAALGGIDHLAKRKKPNTYLRTTFMRCDLRHSSHSCENYRFCNFTNCRLDGVQFFGAVLEDCTFRGKLKGVEFRKSMEGCEEMPQNRLLRCDFRGAELIDCVFRQIDLDLSMFTPEADWIVLPRGPEDLRRWHKLIPTDTVFIPWAIKAAGTPTFLRRSSLERSRLTEEQIGWLIDIAQGKA